jgi:hypothetical protein
MDHSGLSHSVLSWVFHSFITLPPVSQYGNELLTNLGQGANAVLGAVRGKVVG